jgi:4-aminobutyrate--pyruvate transaminase
LTASLTAVPDNQRFFNLPLDGFLHVRCPHYYRKGLAGESEEQFTSRLIAKLEETIQREGPETIAAFFTELGMGLAGDRGQGTRPSCGDRTRER